MESRKCRLCLNYVKRIQDMVDLFRDQNAHLIAQLNSTSKLQVGY